MGMEKVERIKGWVVVAFTTLTTWLGALALPLGLLVVCNVLDYLTGLGAAPARGQKRSSRLGLAGIAKKVCSWLLVAVGMVTDTLLEYLAQGLGWQPPFSFAVATLVCTWLLANELLSVIENIGDITGEVPSFLRPVISWVKGRTEDAGQGKPGS